MAPSALKQVAQLAMASSSCCPSNPCSRCPRSHALWAATGFYDQAWTNTADWAFSQKIPPQNLIIDEHYLCTVAAGGHEKVVKPQRMGVRHGHPVVVNRQLCIANAFEQVLEEKTPRFHRFLRRNYDRYGYPFAKHIKKKWAMDLIYYLMKPLEWLFLLVLYLVDHKPENRIAMQYIKPIPEDFDPRKVS